jgi:hypothetical protein
MKSQIEGAGGRSSHVYDLPYMLMGMGQHAKGGIKENVQKITFVHPIHVLNSVT